MLIFENQISKSFYDEEKNIIRYEFYGRAKPDLMIEQLNTMLEYTDGKTVNGIFADIKKLQGSFIKIFDWLNGTYYPSLLNRGLHTIIFVVSTDLIANNLTERISEMLASEGVTVKAYRKYEDAISEFARMIGSQAD